jgi:hypothetical protein
VDLEQMAVRNRTIVEDHRVLIAQTLQDLNGVHDEMQQALTEMSSDSSQLAGDVSSAVQGLQFQDRTNQRIAHIVEALEDMYQRFSAHCGDQPVHDEHYMRDLLKRYTMEEERHAAGVSSKKAVTGELELF